jgi:hypothetical protein
MYFLAIISPQLHYFSHNAVIDSRHILAIFLARVKPLIHITRNRTPYRGAETATEDMFVPPEKYPSMYILKATSHLAFRRHFAFSIFRAKICNAAAFVSSSTST